VDPEWNPVLSFLKLPKFSELWAKPNFAFPWPDQPIAKFEFPIRTLWTPDNLKVVQKEISGLIKEDIESVPSQMFLENPEDNVSYFHQELWEGLQTFLTWVNLVEADHCLLTIIEGDQ
jgi:hypothetical protein